jgi:hypothetical protein
MNTHRTTLTPNRRAGRVAAVEHVGDLLTEALSTADTTEQALQDAYGTIIEDGDVLRFLMQANCATDELIIRDAVRTCYARQVAVVHKLLDGDKDAVRRWFAGGMLANVTTMLGLADVDEPWAKTLIGA